MEKGNGSLLLSLSVQTLIKIRKIEMLGNKLTMETLLNQFKEDFVQVQSPVENVISNESILLLLQYFSSKDREDYIINVFLFGKLTFHYIKMLNNLQGNLKENEQILCYLLSQFMRLGSSQHESITQKLIKSN